MKRLLTKFWIFQFVQETVRFLGSDSQARCLLCIFNPLKCIKKGQLTCGGQFAISDLDFIETENYPDENYHNDMACSWEIDAQGSYGLYLNMIIYRVDANEDTKYNHFAYYTNQDRKSKKIFEVREAQKSGLLLNTFDF